MATSEVYVQGVVFKDERTGLRDVSLCVGGRDVARLRAVIEEEFEATLTKHVPEEDFSGAIEVAVLSEATPASAELWQALADLEGTLQRRVRGLHTASRRPVSVGVVYTSNDGEG